MLSPPFSFWHKTEAAAYHGDDLGNSFHDWWMSYEAMRFSQIQGRIV